ncbi:unnamed protein product [Diatraea saccharalis]|uniref:Uncharacterized protein n=1 Tax=Diatraea saccharalis TaxID=40085 RepID=A0A9N9QZB8_9NEOP|nr:unnamed protein product [Diatraea saccharalis]
MDLFSKIDHDLLSDDDEEIVQYLDTPFFSRRVFVENDLFGTLRDDEFVKRFRLSKQSAVFLLDKMVHKFPNDFNSLPMLIPLPIWKYRLVEQELRVLERLTVDTYLYPIVHSRNVLSLQLNKEECTDE